MASAPSGLRPGKAYCWPIMDDGPRGAGVAEVGSRFTVSLEVGLVRSGPQAAASTLPLALTEWHTMQPLRTISGVFAPGLMRRMPPTVPVAGLNGKSGDL